MKRHNKAFITWAFVVLAGGSCSPCGGDTTTPEGSGEPTPSVAPRETDRQPATAEPAPQVLLVAQSTFSRNEQGRYTQPDAAKLLIFRPQGNGWHREELTDDQSNVFHKAMVLATGEGEPQVLTIAGDQAALKLWRRTSSGWQAETLWQPTFGGRHNRLRDVELADVTGDGQQDIVLATHDQGVVAVVRRTASGWEAMELDRSENTFVHEIEIGDLDGDNRPEIYATPSRPNLGSGGAQPGQVTRYRWTGDSFVKETVVAWERRHAKEILVTDLTGDGTPELYAALEGETRAGSQLGGELVAPVEIVRLSPGQDSWTSEVVATIPQERQCRFLTSGDLDGDSRPELVAASFSKGIWLFEPGQNVPFSARMLTQETGGFEHASLLADIDGDGQVELFVADDTHGRLLRFDWNNGQLSQPQALHTRTVPQSAITWNLWVAPLPPGV
jgi:hypothetical protein